MNLNFTLSELIKSDTATKYGINNIPKDMVVLDNLLLLIINVLQPLRNYIQKPIIITSGYRCPELNKTVGGVSNSQHVNGQACDLIIKGMTIEQIIDAVKKSGIKYDQCINEYNQWCHISYNQKNNRQQCFKL